MRWLTGLEPPRSAAAFMDEVLPALRERGLGHVELLQKPGEVNLTATIAVTESFGRPCDREVVLAKLRERGKAAFAAEIEAGRV